MIGGLNVDYLTADAPSSHLGTTDVDVLVDVPLRIDRDEQDFGWLEKGLIASGFEPVGQSPWRWKLTATPTIILDLLCDVPDSPGQPIAVEGTALVAPQNLDGPRIAAQTATWRQLSVPANLRGTDEPETVSVKFASLGGYLLAKVAALRGRDESKDAYDLAFVVLYNHLGSISHAAAAIRSTIPVDRLDQHLIDIRAAAARFATAERKASVDFATSMAQSGDPTPPEILAQDAVGAFHALLAELDQA